MKMTRIIISTLTLLIGGFRADAGQDQDTSTIDAFIAQQAKRERGEEYPDARKVVVGDLNGDAAADTAVLYTIEGQGGSNNYTQYLAVFTRSKTGLVPKAYTEVGGKGYRSVELTTVKDKQIDLATLNYAPSDPSCCPSEKGKTRYMLVGRRLKEQRAAPAH